MKALTVPEPGRTVLFMRIPSLNKEVYVMRNGTRYVRIVKNKGGILNGSFHSLKEN